MTPEEAQRQLALSQPSIAVTRRGRLVASLGIAAVGVAWAVYLVWLIPYAIGGGQYGFLASVPFFGTTLVVSVTTARVRAVPLDTKRFGLIALFLTLPAALLAAVVDHLLPGPDLVRQTLAAACIAAPSVLIARRLLRGDGHR